MKLLSRRKPAAPPPQPDGEFAEWLLRQFNGGRPMAAMPYSEVERLCANAGSLLVGAAFAQPGEFSRDMDVKAEHEAALVARRTGDGFKASLADRKNAVIAWPWDHMATSLAWEATRAGDTSEAAVGRALLKVGGAYALRHREQVSAVLDLWTQLAAGVRAGAEPPDLARMGAEMLAAYRAVRGAAG